MYFRPVISYFTVETKKADPVKRDEIIRQIKEVTKLNILF